MLTIKDACTPIEGKNGKTYWHKVGTAFENEKGISIVFDSMPIARLNRDGKVECRVSLFDKREKAEQVHQQQNTSQNNDLGDEIPF